MTGYIFFRYQNSVEKRTSVTRSSRSERSSKGAHYSKNEQAGFEQDANNNFASSKSVESASYSQTQTSSSTKRRSSIPVRQRGESPTKDSAESPKKLNESSGLERNASNEEDEETPKLQRKAKKRLVRKVKRRNNAVVGQEEENQNTGKESVRNRKDLSPERSDGSSVSEDEFLEKESPQGYGSPSISIQRNPVITVDRPKPIKITYRPVSKEDENQADEPRNRRRPREERPKTLPVTLVVKRPELPENTAEYSQGSDEEDTLTSGGENSEADQQRTSIRIVSSAKSSDTEDSSRKLRIEAKSTKRAASKETVNSNTEDLHTVEKNKQTRAEEIYNRKTRRIIKREPWGKSAVKEDQVTAQNVDRSESIPVKHLQTLPRNFKTVRVPIQTQPVSPENKQVEGKQNSLKPKPNQLRRASEGSLVSRSDNQSDTGQSISGASVPSYDASPTGQKSAHQCRRGCTHVVDDTEDGPRIVRRSRDKRRQSNPNQILGRTEILDSRKSRPKSEILRSESLPRSAGRPRIKSTGFEEFVEIHDFDTFNRNKTRTLPNRKKRVTYHEDTKDNAAFSETEVVKEDFQRHLETHQNFTNNLQKQLTPTGDPPNFAAEEYRRASLQEKEGRAKEIRKSIETQKNVEQRNAIGFKNQQKVKGQQRKVEEVRFSQDSQFESQSSEGVKTDIFGSGKLNSRELSNHEKGSRDISTEKQNSKETKVGKREKIREQVIEEHIEARRKSQDRRIEVIENTNQKEEATVQRSQSLPRSTNKEEYLNEKQLEFEEFIRNQRNSLLSQLKQREENRLQWLEEKKEVKVQENKQKIQEEEIQLKRADNENSGRRIEDFLRFPEASKNKRRYKSTNDADSIKQAKEIHSQSAFERVAENSTVKSHRSSEVKSQKSKVSESFLLQNEQKAKGIEKAPPSDTEEIIRVYSRGKVIQLSMETVDRDRFEQRQREYEEIQKRRSYQQQQQRVIEDDRYRYFNNEFEKRNAFYHTQQQYDPNRSPEYNHFQNDAHMNDNVFEDYHDTNTTQITKVKRDQIKGKLDKVYYTICTHYFFPEDHELIVNLHRLGQIEVPRGLSHEDTCIFYNHLYVYEKEEVFAETLAPITPTIKTEVVNFDEQVPDEETLSEHSSANQSYNDETSSQYSSSSRRDRNLYSSLKAQKYYDSRRNNSNEDSMDFGFDSTYETLRRKRKSRSDDDDWNGNRSVSPTSSSGKSDLTYSKPRLLRRSDHFPGVGKEIEDDYPRWTPKSPTLRERDYGLSVALPP
eukprot:gene3674-14934_t